MRGGVQIIGIGSPHGDDQAGWLVAQRLADTLAVAPSCRRAGRMAGDWAGDVEILTLANPLDLVSHLDAGRRTILVDAARGSALPEVARLLWPDPALAREACHSSHGMGLAYALQMAASLGRLPAEVVVYAVRVDACQPGRPPGAGLSARIELAADRIAAEVRGHPQVRGERLPAPAGPARAAVPPPGLFSGPRSTNPRVEP